MDNKLTYEIGSHRGQSVIFIKSEYDAKLNADIKLIKCVKWSRTHKSWYVPDTLYYRKKFELVASSKNSILNIDPKNLEAFKKFTEILQLKVYSQNTIRTYQNEFAHLLQLLKNYDVNKLDTERLKSYFLYCINTLKISENTMNSRINAIKFYFEQVLKRDKIFIEIPRPTKPSILPKVINAADIKKMLDLTTNLKHNTMLKLCYGMGLRVSELVSIKITDVDSKNMQVLIEKSKGKKDRYVNLPESILEQLRKYFVEYKPKKYLFEGQFGEEYSIRSAQSVFKQALKRANINKKVGIHGMRHSFATHLLENGTDISYIQNLLGHNDIKTTLIYAKVSKKNIKNVKSPLDFL